MPSSSLDRWETSRSARIDELLALKSKAVGGGAGRKWGVGEFNLVVVLKLSAEFQGFSRDLHRESAGAIRDRLTVDTHVAKLVLDALSVDLKLAQGNATLAALTADFRRIGIPNLKDALVNRDSRSAERLRKLEIINGLRNGVAHQDQGKIDFHIQWWHCGPETLRGEVAPTSDPNKVHSIKAADLESMRRCMSAISVTLDKVALENVRRLFPRRGDPWPP